MRTNGTMQKTNWCLLPSWPCLRQAQFRWLHSEKESESAETLWAHGGHMTSSWRLEMKSCISTSRNILQRSSRVYSMEHWQTTGRQGKRMSRQSNSSCRLLRNGPRRQRQTSRLMGKELLSCSDHHSLWNQARWRKKNHLMTNSLWNQKTMTFKSYMIHSQSRRYFMTLLPWIGSFEVQQDQGSPLLSGSRP